jgi:hypothetical protein
MDARRYGESDASHGPLSQAVRFYPLSIVAILLRGRLFDGFHLYVHLPSYRTFNPNY